MSRFAEQDASWQRLVDSAKAKGYRVANVFEREEYVWDLYYFSCGGPRFLPIAKYGEETF